MHQPQRHLIWTRCHQAASAGRILAFTADWPPNQLDRLPRPRFQVLYFGGKNLRNLLGGMTVAISLDISSVRIARPGP